MNKALYAGTWGAWVALATSGVILATSGVILATGCVIEAMPAPAGVVVSGPPPAPMQEARPAPVVATSVWIPGYWHWTGMQYTWIPGHWEAGPPGARWRAPRYLLRDGVYYYEPGGWGTR